MIHLAEKEASRSKAKFRLGAVVTKGKRVLGKGYNENKTHPLGSGDYKKIHSETSAICEALRKGIDLAGASIYVYRAGKVHGLMARPCPCCMELIRSVGITDIYYTNRFGEITHELV